MVPIRDPRKFMWMKIEWYVILFFLFGGFILFSLWTVFLRPSKDEYKWSLSVRARTKNHLYQYQLDSAPGCRSLWQPGCCEPSESIDHVNTASTERICRRLLGYIVANSRRDTDLTPRDLGRDLYNYADPELVGRFQQQVGEELIFLEVRVSDSFQDEH